VDSEPRLNGMVVQVQLMEEEVVDGMAEPLVAK
jgi:hypothetical protein